MARSLKKGPYCEASLLAKVEKMNEANDKTGYQNLVPSFHHLPPNDWAYICRA